MKNLFYILTCLFFFTSCVPDEDVEFLEFDDVKMKSWSVSSNSSVQGFVVGEEYTFVVTYSYNLISYEHARIDFGINSEEEDVYELLDSKTKYISKGKGEGQISVTTEYKSYGLGVVSELYTELEEGKDTLLDSAVINIK